MKQIPVSTLEGTLLAEKVARAQEWEKANIDGINFWCNPKMSIESGRHVVSIITMYRPDINGGQAMELAEKFGVDIIGGFAEIRPSNWDDNYILPSYGGNTYRVAICRAVVASKFGEYVEVEDAV